MDIEVEAFRADTKASKGLTTAHIQRAAALYNAETAPAPLVFGHPTSDSPSLGIVSGARAEGNKLFLKLRDIADSVVQGVKERRIINRSIAFWSPDHPSNPNPGEYSIRHLGLLGGQAPAIPNMPALKFSADDTVLESDGSDQRPADAVVFEVEVEEAPTPVQTIKEPAPTQEPTMNLEEQLANEKTAREAAEARVTALETAEAERAKNFAAAETARREGETKTTLDGLVAEGKVLPAERDNLEKLFNALPTTSLTFSDGEAEPRLALGKFLGTLPKRAPVNTPQASPTKEFNADDAKARADAALKAANERTANAYKTPAAV